MEELEGCLSKAKLERAVQQAHGPERSRGAVSASAQEPPWDPARVKACDRTCLTGMMDRYVGAMMKHDRTGLPLEPEDGRVSERSNLPGA